MKIIQIITGWFNYFFRRGNIDIEAMAKARAEICSGCPFKAKILTSKDYIKDNANPSISGMYCVKCLCPLPSKIRSPFSFCPIFKWGAELKIKNK
jgi:hypothetical protein